MPEFLSAKMHLVRASVIRRQRARRTQPRPIFAAASRLTGNSDTGASPTLVE
jgi:hypothetical protein